MLAEYRAPTMFLHNRFREPLLRTLEMGVVVLSLGSLLSLVLTAGFFLDEQERNWLRRLDYVILEGFIFQLLFRMLLVRDRVAHFLTDWAEYALGFVLAVFLIAEASAQSVFTGSAEQASLFMRVYLAGTQALLALFALISLARASRVIAGFGLQPARLVCLSFLGSIVLGAALLGLPRMTTQPLSLTDLFFLSTSAVCVTGLSPVDITAALTFNGQVVLLVLIQVGGLGIMTLAAGIGLFFGGLGGMRQQVLLRDILDSEGTERLRGMLKAIMLVTFGAETLGAISLWLAWGSLQPEAGLRAWWALFHSVSAFCNAGFSIIPGGLAHPACAWNPPGLTSIAALVFLGGLGAPVLHECVQRFRGAPRLSLGSRLILKVHVTLFLVGAVLLWVFGSARRGWTLGSLENALTATFMSVMPRTAGFQNLGLLELGSPSLFLIVLLMVIGGAPGSTAGGVKLTVLAIAGASLRALVRSEPTVVLARREISLEACLRALALLLLYLVVALLATFVLVVFADIPLFAALFEVVSALSTVGLSLDLTPTLTQWPKWLLIACMFCGRLGLLTVLWALFRQARPNPVAYPRENLPLF